MITKYFINNNTTLLKTYNGIDISPNSNYQIDSIDILQLSTDHNLTVDLLSSNSLTTISEATVRNASRIWDIASSIILTGQLAIDSMANYFSPVTIVNQSGVSSFNGLTGVIVDTSSDDLLVHQNASDPHNIIPMITGICSNMEYAIVRDVRPLGSDGGTSRKDKWNVRSLNTISYNIGNIVQLVGDDILLKVGTYIIRITAPAKEVKLHKLRIFNETTNTTIVEGSAFQKDGIATLSSVIISNGIDLYEIQHYTEKKQEKEGLGEAMNIGSFEVYTSLEIFKIRG